MEEKKKAPKALRIIAGVVLLLVPIVQLFADNLRKPDVVYADIPDDAYLGSIDTSHAKRPNPSVPIFEKLFCWIRQFLC